MPSPTVPPPKILVAGVGNIFFGDDGFGVEVVRRLAVRPLPDGVRVVDFGIRGLDLAYTLLDGYDAVFLVDAVQRGGAPGSLYLIEPESGADDTPAGADTHGMHPARVLQMVRALGGKCDHVRIVGCEPATFGSDEDPVMGLSEPVAAAVDGAVRTIEELLGDAGVCEMKSSANL